MTTPGLQGVNGSIEKLRRHRRRSFFRCKAGLKESERSEVLFLPRSEAKRPAASERYPQQGDTQLQENYILTINRVTVSPQKSAPKVTVSPH